MAERPSPPPTAQSSSAAQSPQSYHVSVECLRMSTAYRHISSDSGYRSSKRSLSRVSQTSFVSDDEPAMLQHETDSDLLSLANDDPSVHSSIENLDFTSLGTLQVSPTPSTTSEKLTSLYADEEVYRCTSSGDDRGISSSTTGLPPIRRSESTSAVSRYHEKHTKELAASAEERGVCSPDYITPISSLTCTSNGLRFVDEANDFILEIPERAISQSDSLTIDVGVALFGPFQFPKGLRPVSPVFWVCVRSQPNFIFSKPVSLTIPHFLNLESDREIRSLGLTFLKAGHEQNPSQYYELHKTDGEVVFDLAKQTGLLHTKHFCSFCIACKDKPTCLSMAKFCLTYFLPKRAIIGKQQLGFIFITLYNLKTCLAKVDEVIQKKELQHYRKTQVEFDFKSWFYKDAALEINITQPAKGKIGLMGKKKIFRSEVDFFLKRRTAAGDMKGLEEKDFYPPRFQIFLVSTADDTSLSEGKIKFKGARSELEFDIFLEQPEPDVSLLSQTSSSTQSTEIASSDASIKRLDTKDILCVRSYLKDLDERELKDLFQELGLDYSTVNDPTGSRQDIAEKLIRAWILEKDDVLQQQEYTGATWDDLRKALKKLKHHGIARTIPV